MVDSSGAEHVGQLGQRRIEVQQTKTRHGTADVVVRDGVVQRRQEMGKIIPVPER